MEMKDLLTISTGTTSFQLTDIIQSKWNSIGMQLGVEMLNLISEEAYMPDAECLKIVWKSWFDECYSQKEYPPTWSGLKKLLKDIGQDEVCREFFDSVANSFIC